MKSGEVWVICNTDLWTSTVAGFIFLLDPITTDGVPYCFGGLVGETATKVVGVQPSVEVSSTATAPLGGRRPPTECIHDALPGRVCTCAITCVCVCVCVMWHCNIMWHCGLLFLNCISQYTWTVYYSLFSPLNQHVYKNVPLTSIMAHVKDMSQLMGCCDSNTADCPSTVLRDSNRMSIWTHLVDKSFPHYVTIKVNSPVENMRQYVIYSTFTPLKMNGYAMISAAACGANVYNHHKLLYILTTLFFSIP